MSWPQTINGTTYQESDFIGPTRPYLINFPKIIGDVATVGGQAQTAATNAAASAASTGATGTSSTSLTVGTGAKSLTASTGKAWVVGSYVKIARTSAPTTTHMKGTVTAYNSATGALDVTVDQILGTGTHTDWSISVTTEDLEIKFRETSMTHNLLVAGVDYVIGYIDYDCTITGGTQAASEGSGSTELYLSSNRTSASGTLIIGGSFTVGTSVDDNSFTANNTVTEGAPRYLVQKCTASTGMKNVVNGVRITKKASE